MKQFLAIVLAVLAMGGIYAMTAGATQQGVSPAKFAKLSKQVKKLKKQVAQINGQLSCFTSVVPATQYGGYTGTDSTTALDVTHQGDNVGAFLLTVDPSCVGGGKAPTLLHQLHTLR